MAEKYDVMIIGAGPQRICLCYPGGTAWNEGRLGWDSASDIPIIPDAKIS